MKQYKYIINNLDCANCAREIEESLNNNPDFKHVVVNFNTSKLTFESEKDFSIEKLNYLIKKIDPDAYLTTEPEKTNKQYHVTTLILGVLIGVLAYFLPISNITKMIFYVISYSLLLYKTFTTAIIMLYKNKSINENALITISCLGALIVKEPLEGIMVIGLYTIGKILEQKAVDNSRKSIKDLINIKQPFANKKNSNKIYSILVEEVKINDTLVIKKGEKIPVDGIVKKGSTTLDTSALTGESEPLIVKANDKVLSGSINLGDVIEITATSTFQNSTVSKILDLLDYATDKKTKTETIVSKISKIYTPIILLLAISMSFILPLIFNVELQDAIYRSLTFLVISCPCAIAISVPLSYFTAIGISSKNGILIKGSNYLDNLSNMKNIIFDKTGTLTNGTFQVNNIIINDKNYTKKQVIDILVKGESLSNHPIAKSIITLKKGKIYNKDVKNFKEISGKGISFTLDGKKVSIGSESLCNCEEEAILHLNISGKHIASIDISDGIKENAKVVIENLQKMGIKTYMFTGDKKEIALTIGKALNIDEIKYNMLPTDKYDCYEKIAENGLITSFVGDGINDAPVLKRADIGISMGGVGSDCAIEASDIVIMKDDLSKIPFAISISKFTKKIIKQNLLFAMLVKVSILILSTLGLANMWLAVFADTGVTLLTIINTLRILKKYE